MTSRTRSVDDVADEVVSSDVSSQMRYATWAKGHVPTQIGFIREPTKCFPILISIVLIGSVGGIGFIIGTGLIGSQPIATPVAAVPTATAVPEPSAPGDPTGQPTPESTGQPTVAPQSGQPTTPPTVPPPTDPPAVTGLATAGDVIPITDISRFESGPALLAEVPGQPVPPGAPESAELLAMEVGVANLDSDAVAALNAFIASNLVAVIQDEWPCGADGVFCGPQQLAPGEYYVIGFATAEPPPTSGATDIVHTFSVLTDLDGDWTNNGLVTPPRINNVFLSTQYVIEGGWYQENAGLGETDYRGPVGPDGQTARFNQAPASRLVLTQDPPGGFFLIPSNRMGPWFRLASLWQDFSGDSVVTAVDWVASGDGLAMLPTPLRGELPQSLQCGRVDLVAVASDGQPSQMVVTVRFQDGVQVPAQPVLDVTLLAQPANESIAYTDLPLAGTDEDGYRVAFGVPAQATSAFASIVLRGAGADDLDLTEEFIVLAGAGVAVPAGAEGPALGTDACGAGP